MTPADGEQRPLITKANGQLVAADGPGRHERDGGAYAVA